MTAKLYSLNAFKIARTREGLSPKLAVKFSHQIATEMEQDGELEPRVVQVAAGDEEARATIAEYGAEFGVVAAQAKVVEYDRKNPHPQVTDFGGNYGYSVGSKYNKTLDVTDIAKRLRGEIKDRIAKGDWPKGLKVSVKISRFAGGRSISMNVNACPWPMLNPARVREEAKDPNRYLETSDFPRYTEFGTKVLKDLEAMARAYQYDRSDSQTDYSDTNFYLHVDYHWESEKAEREAILAQEKRA